LQSINLEKKLNAAPAGSPPSAPPAQTAKMFCAIEIVIGDATVRVAKVVSGG